jgi:hypothetical protein
MPAKVSPLITRTSTLEASATTEATMNDPVTLAATIAGAIIVA